MERSKKENLLRVEREDDGTAVEIKGTNKEILANWAILTDNVCERLNIQPILLAAMLPGMMADVRRTLTDRVSVDLDAIRRAKEGGHGTGK